MNDDFNSREPGSFEKLLAIVKEAQIGLLTTTDGSGLFHTRPVQTLAINDRAETLWFFTDRDSIKAKELCKNVNVSIGYARPGRGLFAALYGEGWVRHDPIEAERLWRSEQRAYYPLGPADPRLGVLEVRIDRAEYWIAPGRLSYWVAAAKAAITGSPERVIGENRKLS